MCAKINVKTSGYQLGLFCPLMVSEATLEHLTSKPFLRWGRGPCPTIYPLPLVCPVTQPLQIWWLWLCFTVLDWAATEKCLLSLHDLVCQELKNTDWCILQSLAINSNSHSQNSIRLWLSIPYLFEWTAHPFSSCPQIDATLDSERRELVTSLE